MVSSDPRSSPRTPVIVSPITGGMHCYIWMHTSTPDPVVLTMSPGHVRIAAENEILYDGPGDQLDAKYKTLKASIEVRGRWQAAVHRRPGRRVLRGASPAGRGDRAQPGACSPGSAGLPAGSGADPVARRTLPTAGWTADPDGRRTGNSQEGRRNRHRGPLRGECASALEGPEAVARTAAATPVPRLPGRAGDLSRARAAHRRCRVAVTPCPVSGGTSGPNLPPTLVGC